MAGVASKTRLISEIEDAITELVKSTNNAGAFNPKDRKDLAEAALALANARREIAQS